jgi:hypothetical protein
MKYEVPLRARQKYAEKKDQRWMDVPGRRASSSLDREPLLSHVSVT